MTNSSLDLSGTLPPRAFQVQSVEDLKQLCLDEGYSIILSRLSYHLGLSDEALWKRLKGKVSFFAFSKKMLKHIQDDKNLYVAWTPEETQLARQIWGENWKVDNLIIHLEGRPYFLKYSETLDVLKDYLYQEGQRGPNQVTEEHLRRLIVGDVRWETRKPSLNERSLYQRCFILTTSDEWGCPAIRYERIQKQ